MVGDVRREKTLNEPHAGDQRVLLKNYVNMFLLVVSATLMYQNQRLAV